VKTKRQGERAGEGRQTVVRMSEGETEGTSNGPPANVKWKHVHT
jgi:hypothetical protein